MRQQTEAEEGALFNLAWVQVHSRVSPSRILKGGGGVKAALSREVIELHAALEYLFTVFPVSST